MGNNDSFGYWDDEAPSRTSRRWLGLLGVAVISSCLTCALLFVLLHLTFTAQVLRPIFGLDPKVTPAVVHVKPPSTPTPTPSVTPTASASQATPTPTLNPAEAQIVYRISQTTERTFDAQTSEADAAALLTSFGLPLTEQSVPVGVNSPQASWQVAGIVNDIQGAVYDDATGQLFLIGTNNPNLPALDETDLLVALRAVYTSGEPVGVSIDPINPNELGGPMQVNYYGDTAKTHFGLVMFEADRHLKTLSAGEDNITGQPATSAVPGYKSELAWMLDLRSGDANPSWHRMWYVVPNGELAIKVSSDSRAMMFDEVPLVVQARFVEFDANGEKHDVPGSDPAIDAFVGHLNQYFDAYAAEKPEVGQLKSLAKLLSIARWLYDQGAALDLDWLSGLPVDTVQTPDTTPGTITSLSRSDAHTVYTVQLFGGVDFQFENRVVVPPAGDPVHFLGERVRAAVTQSESNVAVLAANGAEARVEARPLVPMPTTGSLALAQTVLRVPADGKPPLEAVLFYDASSETTAPVGPGWTVEPSEIRLPEQLAQYKLDGAIVPMPDAVVLRDRTIGSRVSYRNAEQIINTKVQFTRMAGNGSDVLEYDYLTGQFRVTSATGSDTYDSAGALQSQQRGAERIEYRRDAAGRLLTITHSDGRNIRFEYDGTRLVQVRDSAGQQADLSFGDAGLAGVAFPEGSIRVAGIEAPVIELRTGDGLLQIELDQLGRVMRRTNGTVERSFAYGDNGGVMEYVTGLPNASLTIERNRAGRITRLIATEEILTSDATQARQNTGLAMLQPESILQQSLEGKALELTSLVAGSFRQVALEPVGRWTMRSEGTTLFVDGRLSHAIARDAWLAAERRIADLAAEGYADWALDPATGTLVARSRQTGGVKASITRGSGEMIEASYADFHFAPADLSRLATVLGAQQRGVNTIGLFRSVEGSWGLVTSSGEIRPFLAGAHAELATLEGLVNNPDAEETANSLADYLGDQLAEELRANFSRAWPEGMGADLSTAFFKTYPSAQVLYPQGIPADIQQVFQEMSSLRPLAEPIQTPYGWLLPGSGPYLLDAPPSAALALLLSRSLGANDIRMVAPSSTPLRVTAYLQEEARRQSRVTGKDMVVLFTPHSESSEEDASIERAEFEPLRRRLEQLGARVIDVGGDPTGHQQVLNELASQDLVIFDIGHSGLDGTMYVYQDGNVHPDQFVTARGVKYFMTCCSVHNGLAGAAVRSGADIAVGTTSPLTQRDVNIVLSALAGHLEQHGEGTLPSALDYLIRLRILHDQGGPTPASGILPVSFHNVPSIM